MSGDVQPRKRKEKRRKKDGEYTVRRISSASVDDEDSGTPPPPLVSAAETTSDNVNIHVYKESSTGGHWCARIVFFILLAILVGLIGVIIFEHRGTTDVDTPIESSRWAFVFEGWVDDSPPSHDDEPHEETDHEEASEEEELEEAEEGEGDEDEGHGDEDEAEGSKEEEGEGEDAEHEETEYEGEEEQDEGIGEDEDQEEDEGDGVEASEEADEAAEDEEGYVSTELNDQDEDEGIEQDDQENDGDQDFDDAGVLEEVNVASDENNADDDDNTLNEEENEFEDNVDGEDVSEELKNDDVSEEFLGIPGVNEIDDDGPEPLEEVEGIEPEEVTDVDLEPEIEEEIEEESASVAVKFGVGVALVVAAHFVLVRRWNNAEDISDFNSTPDLSRRNTIVPPPHLKEVTQTAATNEEQIQGKKQARNYEELRSKYSQLGIDNISKNVSVEQLQSAIERQELKKSQSARDPAAKEAGGVRIQSKVISSEEEEDEGEEVETSEEGVSGAEEYEDEGEYDEEEAEEEEEEGEEEEEEVENIDDSELIAKLEAKYGKLPTPQDSEEEVEEEEEEEEEEDEEIEDDDMAGWKRVNVPKRTSAESRSSQKAVQEKIKKAEGGGKAYSFNISSSDDVHIREGYSYEMPQEYEN